MHVRVDNILFDCRRNVVYLAACRVLSAEGGIPCRYL